MKLKYSKTLSIVLVGLFTALIIVGAFIKIPVPVVPFTMQVFFIAMAGLILGPWLGAASAFCYMALGLMGVPVFTQGGGIWYVFQPTFGYIVAFIIGAFVTGYITNKVPSPSYKRLFVGVFAGLAIIYFVGVLYMYFMSRFYLESGMTLWQAILYGFIMCAPGDIIFNILACFIYKKINPFLNRYRLS